MNMTILRDLSVLWSLFHILILFILLYRSRYPRKKTVILTGIFMTPIVALNVAGLALYGTELMGKVFLLTCTLPGLVFFWFLSGDRKGQFFFTFCLADTVSYWIIVITNLADFYFGGEKYILMFIGRLVLFPLLEWAAVRFLRKFYRELQESAARGWGLFAGMTALYYLLLAVMANYPVIITKRPQELLAFLFVLALMPMTYATILAAMFRQLLFFRKQQAERMLLEQKNSLEARLEDQQRIRKMKHDMKGYTATLSGLLAEGKTEEALTYMELCQILSNGLENACDAVRGLEKEKRRVSVHMRYNRNYLLIRIRNRCRDGLYVERGELPATDKEGADHGFGLAAIREAAKRLDGEIFCYTEDGDFILDVMVSCRAFPNTG